MSYLFVFACVEWWPTDIALRFLISLFSLCVLCAQCCQFVSDCPFLIAPLVFIMRKERSMFHSRSISLLLKVQVVHFIRSLLEGWYPKVKKLCTVNIPWGSLGIQLLYMHFNIFDLFALLERYYILNYVVPIISLSKYEINFALYHYLSYIWWVET